ncbi:MAG: hypothetical protein ACLURV_10975 [Gallintestinimicrobium sp.]
MNPLDFSVEELDQLFDLANDIENTDKYAHTCEGKKLATCFYEPSTRTRLSFEAAMMNLGGKVLDLRMHQFLRFQRRKCFRHDPRHSCYADICAMRHPKEGAPIVAAEKSRIPVINAGDGGHQHPTQTYADLLTIRSLKGHLNNLTIGLCGDLKFGRTVHSLVNALSATTTSGSSSFPTELRVPDYITEMLREKIFLMKKSSVWKTSCPSWTFFT